MNEAISAKMQGAIADMTDPKGLRQVMKNARNKKREDFYRLALQRLCEVQGNAADDPSDPIVRRVMISVYAREELRGGRRATRTRQMLETLGPVDTTKQWIEYGKPTDPYVVLVEAGLWHLPGEAIPLDFPERLTDGEIAVVRYCIADAKRGRVSDPFLPAVGEEKSSGV
jgi:hypothetical protein